MSKRDCIEREIYADGIEMILYVDLADDYKLSVEVPDTLDNNIRACEIVREERDEGKPIKLRFTSEVSDRE